MAGAAGTDAQTWILTGSPENYAVTRERDFRLIGCKEGRRRQALAMEPGDRIVLYLTRVVCFAASVLVTGEMFEDRTPVWPGKPGKADPYPWRLETEPELVLEEPQWLPAVELVDELDHIAKWPREHWKLAFQGQLRRVSPADAAALTQRMQARANVPA
jgi:hypothetical protein